MFYNSNPLIKLSKFQIKNLNYLLSYKIINNKESFDLQWNTTTNLIT